MLDGPLPGRAGVPPADAPASARRVLVRTAVLLRVADLLPCPVGMAFGAGYQTSHLPMAIVSYTIQVTWSLFFIGRAWHTSRLSNRMMLVDLVVAALCLMASGRATEVNYSASWTNPAVAPAMGTAVAVGVSWWRLKAIAAAGVLVGSYLFGVLPSLRVGAPTMTSIVGNVLSLLVFTMVAGTISSLMLRHAETVRVTTVTMLADRERAAEERARFEERNRHYRILHDTVMSTLNSVARGTVNGARIRERCAADANLIRSMISGDPGTLSSLPAELAYVVRSQVALGLRVHSQFGALPDTLPAEVISALSGACREALNNVIKHAGTNEAWVTATENCGVVTVTVVDRGPGIAEGMIIAGGFGLSRSIEAPMVEVGGVSKVDSAEGEGTCVELKWPA